MLLDAALARMEASVVRLWTAVDNERSRRFYEAYGFSCDGAADTYSLGGVELSGFPKVLHWQSPETVEGFFKRPGRCGLQSCSARS